MYCLLQLIVGVVVHITNGMSEKKKTMTWCSTISEWITTFHAKKRRNGICFHCANSFVINNTHSKIVEFFFLYFIIFVAVVLFFFSNTLQKRWTEEKTKNWGKFSCIFFSLWRWIVPNVLLCGNLIVWWICCFYFILFFYYFNLVLMLLSAVGRISLSLESFTHSFLCVACAPVFYIFF